MPQLPELPKLALETWAAAGAILLGLFLCFRGFASMRWILALIGGFAGWQLGSWAATYISFDPDFVTALRWGAVIFSVILVGSLAYAFFYFGVLAGIGWVGYALAQYAVTQLGWGNWAGSAAQWLPFIFGAILAIAAMITKVPRLILIVLTGIIGAAAAIAGALSLFGSLSLLQLSVSNASGLLGYGLLWNLGFLALAAAGIIVQLKSIKHGNLHSVYA